MDVYSVASMVKRLIEILSHLDGIEFGLLGRNRRNYWGFEYRAEGSIDEIDWDCRGVVWIGVSDVTNDDGLNSGIVLEKCTCTFCNSI